MTRAFTPPESLSKEDIRAIADVRRDIWTNGFYGMGVGALSGLSLHTAAYWANSRKLLGKNNQMKLNSSTALFSFLGGASLGSYIMAATAGKNEVHNLHPVFEVGKKIPPNYATKSLDLAQQREQDQIDRERNRFIRRESLKNSMESGHGLSDSHGGQWTNDTQDMQRNRHARRASVTHTIEHGRGLSDSHGGDWTKDTQDMQRNRDVRRVSITDTIEHGQGVSDSHGGSWDNEQYDDGNKRRNL